MSGYAGLLLFPHRRAVGPRVILVAGALYVVSVLFGRVGGLVRQLVPRTPSRSLRSIMLHGDRCRRARVLRLGRRPLPRRTSSRSWRRSRSSGDFVRNVGGDRVEGRGAGRAERRRHVYARRRPTRKVADAKVVSPTGSASRAGSAACEGVRHQGAVIVATKGIKPRKAAGGHGHGHASRPACLAVGREREDLRRQYPRRAGRGRSGRQGAYEANAAAYLGKLDALDER